MKKSTSGIRQSSIFLIELIIAILFLSLCSAICIRLFVNARLIENQSYKLTQAVSAVQNIAEIFENDSEHIVDYFNSSKRDGSNVTIYYNNDFTPCRDIDASYTAKVKITHNNNIYNADINITEAFDSSKIIYSLHVDHAKGGTANE